MGTRLRCAAGPEFIPESISVAAGRVIIRDVISPRGTHDTGDDSSQGRNLMSTPIGRHTSTADRPTPMSSNPQASTPEGVVRGSAGHVRPGRACRGAQDHRPVYRKPVAQKRGAWRGACHDVHGEGTLRQGSQRAGPAEGGVGGRAVRGGAV